MKSNRLVDLYKDFAKSFFIRFALAIVIIGGFYYLLYYLPGKISREAYSIERLGLENIADKLNQVNQSLDYLSRYDSVDAGDFIVSADLYRAKAQDALALTQEIGTMGGEMIERRQTSFLKKLLFAVATRIPGRNPDIAEYLKYAAEPYLKLQSGAGAITPVLVYFLENQKALLNLFEYIPELDFQGLSVSNGRNSFIKRLDLADGGLKKIIDRFSELKNTGNIEDPTAEKIISTLADLRASVLGLKQAVIAGDHAMTESKRADFASSVYSAKKSAMKNRVSFLENYLKQNDVPAQIENMRLELTQMLGEL